MTYINLIGADDKALNSQLDFYEYNFGSETTSDSYTIQLSWKNGEIKIVFKSVLFFSYYPQASIEFFYENTEKTPLFLRVLEDGYGFPVPATVPYRYFQFLGDKKQRCIDIICCEYTADFVPTRRDTMVI